MDEQDFRKFLKRGGRSNSAINRVLIHVKEFEQYLQTHRHGKEIAKTTKEDLEGFTSWVEETSGKPAKTHLWALRYYYEYISNDGMRALAGTLREKRMQRKPYPLKQFRGVNPAHVERLVAAGITNVDQMLATGRTADGRKELATKTRLSLDTILEFVKLSDLARIDGLKSIRARLYHDAGIDTVEKLSQWKPEELRSFLAEFIVRTGFDGTAPLPKEAEHAVLKARKLPKVVEY